VGQYVDIAGIDTWYDEYGAGEPLVLLHGGMCTNETWAAQVPAFAERFRVLAPERRGHGHTADVEGPLHYGDMASDTVGFLEQIVGGPAHLVGWSDGGIIGLLVAIRRPDLVRKLVVIGTNFDTSGVAPEAEEMLAHMDPAGDEVAMFRDAYVAHSPDGAEHWPVFFAKFVAMASSEPHIAVEQLAQISAPTLVVAGDDDVVTLEHTVALYRAVLGAELAVVPGTSHAVMLEKPALLNMLVLDFLDNEPVPTMLPLRRAHEAHVPG
jgi:pimeloyl-ACP methyl ester carboxylesterase